MLIVEVSYFMTNLSNFTVRSLKFFLISFFVVSKKGIFVHDDLNHDRVLSKNFFSKMKIGINLTITFYSLHTTSNRIVKPNIYTY